MHYTNRNDKCQCDSLLHNHTEYHTCNILVSLMSMKFKSDDSCFDANLPSSKMLKSYLLCLCTMNHNLFLLMNFKKQLIYHFTTIIILFPMFKCKKLMSLHHDS